MATAAVIRAWRKNGRAYLAATVDEGNGRVEYIGSVSLDELQGKTAAEIKAILVAAVKAVRDEQQSGETAIAGITGSVTV